MPPATPPAPAQRRLLGLSAGLGVAVLAGVLFTITYDDLRALAIAGHAPRRFAPAYPIMFDVLVTVTILALVMARHARWWARWPRWLLLALLLAGAGTASVQRAIQGYAKIPHDGLKAGVAVAPHVMLLIAVWLWLGIFRHARRALSTTRRTGRRAPEPPRRPTPEPVPEPRVIEPDDPYTDLIPGFADPYEPRHSTYSPTRTDLPDQPLLFPDPVFTPDPTPGPTHETAAWLPPDPEPPTRAPQLTTSPPTALAPTPAPATDRSSAAPATTPPPITPPNTESAAKPEGDHPASTSPTDPSLTAPEPTSLPVTPPRIAERSHAELLTSPPPTTFPNTESVADPDDSDSASTRSIEAARTAEREPISPPSRTAEPSHAALAATPTAVPGTESADEPEDRDPATTSLTGPARRTEAGLIVVAGSTGTAAANGGGRGGTGVVGAASKGLAEASGGSGEALRDAPEMSGDLGEGSDGLGEAEGGGRAYAVGASFSLRTSAERPLDWEPGRAAGLEEDPHADDWIYGDEAEASDEGSGIAGVTRPDMVISELVGAADEDHEVGPEPEDRAEDPDAGEDTDVQWSRVEDELEATPPSSKFRSSPTPPEG